MAKKKAAKSALVYLVLDRSGSMASIAPATIEGCNRFIDETREANPGTLFSLMLFDHEIERVHKAVPIEQVEKLDRHIYEIRGNTALLDAVGSAVSDIAAMEARPDKVVVAVMTDGWENASHEYTREAVVQLISQRETEDKWQFLFLGANIDAFAEAGAIGMTRSASSANWQPSYAGAAAAYMMTSTVTNSYLRGDTATADVDAAEYSVTMDSAFDPNQSISQRIRDYKSRREATNTTP